MKKHDLAYLAGYIDGDGCFDIHRIGSKFRNAIIVSSSNLEILYYLKSSLTGRVHVNTNRPQHQKPYGQWTIQGSKARDFAISILPYLVQRKNECEFFIKFFDSIRPTIRFEIMESLKKSKKADLITTDDLKTLRELIPHTIYTTEDLAYLAGFIDAECCLTIQRDTPKNKPNPVYKIILRLNDTRSTMFYWLKSKFGGCVTWMNKSKGYNPQLIWILRGNQLYNLLFQIVDFLKHKRPIALKLIEFYETTLPNGGARHTEEFRNSYNILLSRREQMVSEVRKLNHKGL